MVEQDDNMADDDVPGRETSPALSDTSELTVLSRSPSPVPEYQKGSHQIQPPFLTPPNTPTRTRAASGRFISRSRQDPSSLGAARSVKLGRP
jgi:hypothetical protein